jgi:hypothetical protein
MSRLTFSFTRGYVLESARAAKRNVRPLLGHRAARFVRMLLKSRLMTRTEFEMLTSEFVETHAGTSEDPAEEFGEFLVQKGALTRWQAEALGHGRYKGWFIDGYRLMERLDGNDQLVRVAAEEIETHSRVVLAIVPRCPRGAKRRYFVEEELGH